LSEGRRKSRRKKSSRTKIYFQWYFAVFFTTQQIVFFVCFGCLIFTDIGRVTRLGEPSPFRRL
jgi:hypothetical protein